MTGMDTSKKRKLKAHLVPGNEMELEVAVMDEPGAGGACHKYRVGGSKVGGHGAFAARVQFQMGPVPEHGHNGLTNEVLLAMVKDRLEGFQNGKHACVQNERALKCIGEALYHLRDRTAARLKLGIEGTDEVMPNGGRGMMKLGDQV